MAAAASSQYQWYPTDPTGRCTFHNPDGLPYEELTCLLPWLRPFYAPFEFTYNLKPGRDMIVGYPWLPLAAVTLYAAGIYFGQLYFAQRKPWDWRRTMALWNLCLATFSFWGFCRTFPKLIYNLSHYSWMNLMCTDPTPTFGSGTEGVWSQLFVLSKFPELIDTFFIVIHKKPLIFLHWYHHITVLLFSWQCYLVQTPNGPFFITMNYFVHAIMYFYYFLMAVKAKPVWFNAEWITVAQISQMIVGVLLTINGWWILLVTRPEGCHLTPQNQMAGLIMYGSYLYLFCDFFVRRYANSQSQKKTTTKKIE